MTIGPTPDARVLRRSSTAPPRLSVVVPNYNTVAYVLPAVRSLLGQTLRELEVIVVDDGSTDDSLARLEAVRDPRLTLISQPNAGLSAARNTGIRHARAPLIGFCDSDDLWHPRKAELQLAAMDHDPSIGVSFSNSAYLRDDGTDTGHLLVCPYDEVDLRRLLRRNYLGNGSTMIVRAACFETAGLFDEGLLSCADWEMWIRIAATGGCRMVRVPEVLTGYRIREDSLSHSLHRFVADAERAISRWRGYVPESTARDAALARAEALRIASRKAFSAGHDRISRQYLASAMRASPTLPFRDVRALTLLVVHSIGALAPRKWSARLYTELRRLIARLQKRADRSGERREFERGSTAVAGSP
jgi:glycosyltransferase involved in cell wall biosynthesis